MKRYLLSILFSLGLLFICFAYSCNKLSRDDEAGYLKSWIDTLPVQNGVKWVVLIPGVGCHGCIQEGESFMKENISNKSILFVLTHIESLKILYHKIDVDAAKCSNVYLDMDNKINIPSDKKIYPCIIELAKGKKIHNYAFQCPDNSNAFLKLKALIDGAKEE